MLHIKRMHVELEGGERAQLPFYVINGRHWATANVVGDCAPTHGGPICYPHSWHKSLSAFATHKLFHCLQTIKCTRLGLAADNNLVGGDCQQITFVAELHRQHHAGVSQRRGNSWQIDPANKNRAARVAGNPQIEFRNLTRVGNEILRGESVVD